MAWLWGICRGYGRMAGLWGSAVMYGEMRQACGRMGKWPVWAAVESHGGTAKTYGKCHGIWETAPAYGRPPGRMGSQKSHQTQKYGNWGGRGLCENQSRRLVWGGRDTIWEDVLHVGNVRNAELYGGAAETYGGFHRHRTQCMACVMPGCGLCTFT